MAPDFIYRLQVDKVITMSQCAHNFDKVHNVTSFILVLIIVIIAAADCMLNIVGRKRRSQHSVCALRSPRHLKPLFLLKRPWQY